MQRPIPATGVISRTSGVRRHAFLATYPCRMWWFLLVLVVLVVVGYANRVKILAKVLGQDEGRIRRALERRKDR